MVKWSGHQHYREGSREHIQMADDSIMEICLIQVYRIYINPNYMLCKMCSVLHVDTFHTHLLSHTISNECIITLYVHLQHHRSAQSMLGLNSGLLSLILQQIHV